MTHKTKREQISDILQFIPAASQTLSKNPTQFVVGVSPVTASYAKGAYLWDIEGKPYLDLILALGPMIFGYGNERIDSAAHKQIERGTIFSLPSENEIVLARLLADVVPCAEMSRFVLNGADATTGAVRLARHITKRDHVAVCGYHGYEDWSICVRNGRSAGVPQINKTLTHEFVYNDIASLRQIFLDNPGEIAAVVLEPVASEKPLDGFLEAVKNVAHEHGAILIFDEMVTGFRWAIGGAQEYFGVVPDIACFGKAISCGYPLAAICGKREYMRHMDEVFVSMTFAGFTLGIASALEAITMMRELGDVHTHMHRTGEYLIGKANEVFTANNLPIEFIGYGPHPVMRVKLPEGDSRLVKTYIMQEMHKAGILFNSSMMIGYIHTEQHMNEVIAVLQSACLVIASNRVGDSFENLRGFFEGDIVAPRSVRVEQ